MYLLTIHSQVYRAYVAAGGHFDSVSHPVCYVLALK